MRSQVLLVSQERVACKSGRLANPGVHHAKKAGAANIGEVARTDYVGIQLKKRAAAPMGNAGQG